MSDYEVYYNKFTDGVPERIYTRTVELLPVTKITQNTIIKHAKKYTGSNSEKGRYKIKSAYIKDKRKDCDKSFRVYHINMSFDIETYTKPLTEQANMWVWQICFNNLVVIGRTWEQFRGFLDLIYEMLYKDGFKIFCHVHNLGYEFSFCRQWLDIELDSTFLKDKRTPLKFEHRNFIVFRDSYAMTNMSLAKLSEVYTTTKKLIGGDGKGDFDYNKARNQYSKIDCEELAYIVNDVVVLEEWAEYYYNNYCRHHKQPLTATAILRDEVKSTFKSIYKSKCKMVMELLNSRKPQSEQEYNELMEWYYRGGYTHANILYINKTFGIDDNITSFDFTSSYPSVMLYNQYPREVFKRLENPTENDIYRLIQKGYAIKLKCTFFGISSKTNQSIESKSKCIYLSNEMIDNGRVRSADIMKVCLLDPDFLTYDEFYRWDDIEIDSLEYARKGYIDKWVVLPMIKYYVRKAELKENEQPYAIEKARVNSFYGLCCQRMPYELTQYDSIDGWRDTQNIHSGNDTEYWQSMKSRYVNPYIGVYISAYARRNLLSNVYKLERSGYSVLYCDTDSLKILNTDSKAISIINDYNNHINAKINTACKYYGIEHKYIADLGMFDQEYKDGIVKFKTLGCKRYLISYIKDGVIKTNQTIAGLPKNELYKMFGDDLDAMYTYFNDGMTIKDCKLISKYRDVPEEFTTYDGTKTLEKSYCALISGDFTLTIQRDWKTAYILYQYQNRGTERRNYG